MHKYIEQICKECNKKFLAREYEVKHGKGQFCSRSCARRFNKRKPKVKVICKYCNKEFFLQSSRAKKRKFCSVECSNKGRRKLNTNKTKSEKGKEYNKKYRERIKKEALKILGNKCFICKKERRLVCHRKNGKNHNSGLTYLMVIKNSDDFVRLCEWCHKAVHWNMKYFNMSWNEIIETLKYNNKLNNISCNCGITAILEPSTL